MQTDMQERIMNVFSTGFSQQPSLLDLFQNNWSQLSVDEAAAPRPHQVAMISHGRASNPHFPTPMDDDAAMATALLAVISSSLPSSSAGPAPQRAALSSRRMAFSPYDSSRAPIVDPSSCYRGQIMIKRSLAIMRHIASMKAHTMFQESPQSVASQFPHVMSERKRREKLNENFVALRTLISPDTRVRSVGIKYRRTAVKLTDSSSQCAQNECRDVLSSEFCSAFLDSPVLPVIPERYKKTETDVSLRLNRWFH